VFEDLHWIDGETQAFLDEFIESVPAARVLLAVNYRPEYRHGWANKTYYRQLRVDPLPPESAEDLPTGLLGSDASVASLPAAAHSPAPRAGRCSSRKACACWSRPAPWSASAARTV
jgi:predicted ATPase